MRKKPKYNYYKPFIDIKETVNNRYGILIIFIFIIVIVLIGNLFVIQVVKREYYVNVINSANDVFVFGSSAPRGRIYDRNGNIIVDNKAVKVIYYKKANNVKRKDELDMAYEVANLIDVGYDKLNEYNLKKFFLYNNKELGNIKITADEWQMLKERKLTSSDIENLKIERITSEDLKDFKEIDQEAAYIYYLMNKGYSYDEKIIKNIEVTEKEYAIIAENISKSPGFNTRLDWERTYPYQEVFRSIIGSISTIPSETKDLYLNQGYVLNDRVGTSYLEYQYESILKGEKNKYELLSDGSHRLIKEGKRGNDIVLTIDINLQKQVEAILADELIKAKQEKNSEYYNRSFVIITNPKTGEILAMAGKQITGDKDNYKIYDYTPGVVTSSVVVGSSIKGASHIVGYNTGALKINEKRADTCVKIASTPLKCSWKKLGNLDDITALKHSSNTYQFYTAIKVGKGKYEYDKPLKVASEAFNIYRNTFAEFGLGIKTGIDLPIESLGYKGNSTLSGHLLDFSIGQYDTYTPIQLSQYISTIANDGNRMEPYLLKSVYSPTKEGLSNLVSEKKQVVLNKVSTEDKYIERVKLGLKSVMEAGGTGYGYINSKYKPAGKTGTSQSFIDTNNDGIVDTETITNTFVAYAPYDNPTVTFTTISPDVGNGENSSYSRVNRRITQRVSDIYFKLY